MSYSGQAVFGGTTDPVTGSWNNATSLNSTIVSSDITGYGVVAASFVISGTVTQGTAVFEVSDDAGTTWWPISGLQTGNNNQSSSYAFTGGSASFEFATGAYNLFRVRLNPVILGSGSVAVRLSAEAFPFLTAVAITGTTNVSITGTNAVTVSGTVAVTQSGAPWSQNVTQWNSVAVGSPSNFGTSPGAVSVIGTNASIYAGTTSLTATGSSLNVNITGGSSSGVQYTGSPAVASGSVVSNLQSGYDGANIRPLLSSTTGQLHVITDSGSTTVVTGTVAVTQSTSPWVVSLTSTTITGTVAVTQSTSPWVVAGAAASGTAKSGNPVQIGGVFNTAQPTVTTGQAVEAQSTARGAQIVATGVDTFNVTVNTALPAGTNVIGHVITDSGSTTVVTGTVAVTQSTSPWVVSLTSTTITGTVAVTQSTTPWTIQGDSASAAANAGNPVKIGGVFNTTQPTVTNGQTVDAQTTARGAQIVAVGVDGFAVTVGGTVAVTQSTSPWVVSLTSTTITGTVAVTQSTTPWTIQGDSASGAAKAGNPVQTGGVFNTAQPTVTTGQTVESQYTARGAQIVATGVDAFAVNATLSAETTKVIGTVNQGTSPWVVSLTSTTITGTVAVTQSTSPWVVNTTQWASTALGVPQTFGTAPTGVVIGTSSDIYVAGTRARSNQTTTAAGVLDVNIVGSLGVTNSVTNGTFTAITDNTTKVGVIAGTTALKTDLSSVAGTATVTAAAGVQKVGIVGNANATLDSTVGAGTAPTNAVAISGIYSTTLPAPTNTQSVAFQLDQAANALTFPGIQFKTGAAWSSATAINTLQFSTGTATAGQFLGSAPALVVQLNQTTTLTGGAVTFQGTYDNINWVTIPIAQVLNPNTFAQLTNPYTFVASTQQPFMILTDGYLNVRANLTSVITGTGSVTPFWAAIPYNPVQFVTVSPNSASFPVTQSPASTSNTAAATWTSATALNTAVTIINGSFSYQSLLITLNQGSTITAGQVTFEVSNDNANWNAIAGVSANQFGTFGENGIYFLQQSTYATGIFNTTTWQYFRVRLSTVITGTGNVVVGFAAQAAGSPPIVAREPKDFGRTSIILTMDDVSAPAAEALQTFTLNRGGTTSSGTTYTVTSGKTFRAQSVTCTLHSTSGTQPCKLRIRAAASVLATSPVYWQTLQSASTATYDHTEQPFPDGLEIASAQQVGISAVNTNGNTTGNFTVCVVGYEY